MLFCTDGVFVGNLPTIAHEVSGKLYFNSPTQIRLSEFSYDGQGPGQQTRQFSLKNKYTIVDMHYSPDAFLYYYRPGVAKRGNGGGIIIPLPTAYATG